MPVLIDRIARTDPNLPCAETPLGAAVKDGNRKISTWQLANAINRAAYWMIELFGKSSGVPVKAYAGPQHLEYLVLIIAGIQTGHQVSPHLSCTAYKSSCSNPHSATV